MYRLIFIDILKMKINRLNFFLIHLATTIIIIIALMIYYLFVIFPMPLGTAYGADFLLSLFVCISLFFSFFILLVYNAKKKEYKRDILIVIIFQIFFIIFCHYLFMSSRPAWIVYHDKQFDLVGLNEVVYNKNTVSLPQFDVHFWESPKIVAFQMPNNNEEKSDLMFADTFGISLSQRINYFVAINFFAKEIRENSLSIKKLYLYNNKYKVDTQLNKFSRAVGWMPLKANKKDMVVLLDYQGKVVKIVDLRPWK